MSEGAIFCARCGAAGQKVNSYCRSCGEWLPDPSGAWHPRGRLRGLSPERKQRRIRVLELLSALAALFAAFIALAVRSGLHRDVLVVTVLLCLLVVAWQGVAFLIGRSLQEKRRQESAEPGPTPAPAQPGATPSLNAAHTGDLIRPHSVTEDPTALLDPSPLKRADKN